MAILEAEADLVRTFNRFYTKQIGLLSEGLLATPFTLTQARVLYELGRQPGLRSTNLGEELGLDPGYLSRLLKSFEAGGLIQRSPSKEDRRASHFSLTGKGRTQFERLDARSRDEIAEMLRPLNSAQRQRLLESMTAIRNLLDGPGQQAQEVVLRAHEPGDIGWVIERHGELYAREYQWDGSFEGFVAEIAGRFLQRFDGRRERCWIAHRGSERLGCIFLVKQSPTVAKLRLLLVEPDARGLSIGSRLVSECISFAQQSGYRKLTLWTNDILHAAARIYLRAGFRLIREEKHHSFGHDLVGQFWEKKLDGSPGSSAGG